MSSFLDSLRDIVKEVQSGVDSVNELKSEGAKLVSGYTKSASEMVDKIQETVKIDTHDKTIDDAQEKLNKQ